jgi:hypothetical protein
VQNVTQLGLAYKFKLHLGTIPLKKDTCEFKTRGKNVRTRHDIPCFAAVTSAYFLGGEPEGSPTSIGDFF